MTRLIRNYQAGSQIVLSDHLRRHLAEGGDAQISESDLARQLRGQAEVMVAEAAAALARAKEQAAALLRQAEENRIVLEAEAQARGFEEGYLQGVAEGQVVGEEMLKGEMENVQKLLLSIQNERSRLLLNAEHEVATLALAISEKVVGWLAQSNEHLITHTVNRALNETAISGPFALRLHPEDAAQLADSWQGAEGDGEGHSWKLIPDGEVGRGGCLLVCGPSSVDARLSSQFKAIINGLGLSDYRLDGEADEPSPTEAENGRADR